ncbi:MAG: glycosyltransferase family 39 protein [Candidatus Zixiibacteriota bacterium]
MKQENKSRLSSFPKAKPTPISLISQRADQTLQKKWVELTFVGILFVIALLIRLSFLKYFRASLSGDAAIYAKIAWGIKNGHGLHWWSVVWSPFYPFMTFLFSLLTGSLETAAFTVSLFWGSLIVVPFFFLAKRIFNYQAAYIGSVLVAFFPALVVISAIPLSEATYTLFFLVTVLFGWLLVSGRSFLSALAFGIFAGICYLTRPESLVAFVFMLLVFGLVEIKGKPGRKPHSLMLILISLLGFLILAFPYVNFMHSQTGHWILSGKTAHNILKQRAYSNSLNYNQQRRAFAEVLDGLTPQGEIKGKVLLGEESMLSFLSAPGFLTDYVNRTIAGAKQMNLFFLPFLLLSLSYMFSWKVDHQGWKERVFLLSAFSPMLTMPVFFVPAGRLIEPYAPLLILLSVQGLLNVRKAAISVQKNPKPNLGFSFGSFAIILTVVVLSLFSLAKADRMAKDYRSTFEALNSESDEFKKLGLWADQILPRDATVMFLSGDSFFFYCNRVTFTVPFASYDRMIEFARRNRIGYLLVSLGKEASWRNDLVFLLEPLKDSSKTPQDPNVSMIEIYKSSSGLGAVLYKFAW